MLGTFYPLDIKGDMRGVLLQIEKSMLRHTHLKFHFVEPHFQRGKKRQLLIKMTTEPEDLPSLSRDWLLGPSPDSEHIGLSLGQCPAPPGRQASPAQGGPLAASRLPEPDDHALSTHCSHPVLPPQPHTAHLATDHMENTRNSETTAVSCRPSPLSGLGFRISRSL